MIGHNVFHRFLGRSSSPSYDTVARRRHGVGTPRQGIVLPHWAQKNAGIRFSGLGANHQVGSTRDVLQRRKTQTRSPSGLLQHRLTWTSLGRQGASVQKVERARALHTRRPPRAVGLRGGVHRGECLLTLGDRLRLWRFAESEPSLAHRPKGRAYSSSGAMRQACAVESFMPESHSRKNKVKDAVC